MGPGPFWIENRKLKNNDDSCRRLIFPKKCIGGGFYGVSSIRIFLDVFFNFARPLTVSTHDMGRHGMTPFLSGTMK